MYLTTRAFFKRASIVIAFLVIVGGGALIFFNTHAVFLYNELAAFDLVPKAENFTELYFNKNATLPEATTGQQKIHFTFVIHNLETTDMHYVYAVVITAQGERHIIDHGSVMVKINRSYVKNEQVQLMNSSGRQNVIVELINKRQSIDFWVEKL